MGKYNPEYHKEYYKKNREKKKAYAQWWRKKNPEKARSYRKNEKDLRYRRVFNLSLDRYNKMLEEQSGDCFICGGRDRNKSLAVDHCHNCGEIRRLLCQRCNMALGYLDDDIDRIKKCVSYLESYVCRDNSNEENNRSQKKD